MWNLNDNKSLKFFKFQDATEGIIDIADTIPLSAEFPADVVSI